VSQYGEQQFAIMMGGPERAEFYAAAQPWLDERTVADIVELGQALRIPAASVADAADVLDSPQYGKRGFFVEGGGKDWSFRQPGPPFRCRKCLQHRAVNPSPPRRRSGAVAPAATPFAGLKVLDLSTFWAGGYLTCYLVAFGADVAAALQPRSIPAEEVTNAERMYDLPGLDVRGFYEQFDHPVTARQRYPGWPLRISPGRPVITASVHPRSANTTTRSSVISACPVTSSLPCATTG